MDAQIVDQPTVTAPSIETPAASPASTPDASSTEKSPLQQAVDTGDTRAYRKERHEQRVRQQKGLPEPPRTPATTKQAGSTEPTPKPTASEPVAPQGEKPRKNADTRVQELLRDRVERDRTIQQLQAQLARHSTPPEQKPAPAPSTPKSDTTQKAWERYRTLPNAPKLDEFTSYEDYMDARAEFIADQRIEEHLNARDSESQQHTQITSAIHEYEQQTTVYRDSVLAWKQANPTAQLADEFLAIEPLSAVQLRNAVSGPDQQTPIGPHHFVVEQVFRADPKVQGPLSHYFSQHPQEFKRLCDLATSGQHGPMQVIREIGRLEVQFLHAPAPTKGVTPASPAARLSAVPAPQTVLGKKPAGVLDPLNAAIQAGDTRRYRELRREQRKAQLAG